MPIGKVWIYQLLFFCVCVCVRLRISLRRPEDRASIVKFCMAVHQRPRQGITHFGELYSPRSPKSDEFGQRAGHTRWRVLARRPRRHGPLAGQFVLSSIVKLYSCRHKCVKSSCFFYYKQYDNVANILFLTSFSPSFSAVINNCKSVLLFCDWCLWWTGEASGLW